MKENTSLVNSFFANFESFYYDMDNTTLSSILEKIKKNIQKISLILIPLSLKPCLNTSFQKLKLINPRIAVPIFNVLLNLMRFLIFKSTFF